jgi:hypothetical protein
MAVEKALRLQGLTAAFELAACPRAISLSALNSPARGKMQRHSEFESTDLISSCREPDGTAHSWPTIKPAAVIEKAEMMIDF